MLVSVYIRKADEDKWRKLPSKTEAISRLLNGSKLDAVVINEKIAYEPRKWDGMEDEPLQPLVFPPKPESRAPEIKQEVFQKLKKELNVPTCKIHGVPLDSRGRCLQKGCKYA